MRSGIRNWTPDEDRIARELRASGLTLEKVGKALKRTASSVNSRLEALDLLVKDGARVRPCLCCRKTFSSAGPHNRLCLDCRRKDVSPYATF